MKCSTLKDFVCNCCRSSEHKTILLFFKALAISRNVETKQITSGKMASVCCVLRRLKIELCLDYPFVMK